MPVARRAKDVRRSALLIGLAAVVFAIILGAVALEFGRRTQTLALGSADFGDLDVQRIGDLIDREGPLLLADIGGGTRQVWLQHIGDEIDQGWSAFDVRQPGDPVECYADWVASTQQFVDKCDGSIYPESGSGLPQIPVFVDGSELTIDINGVRDPERFRDCRGWWCQVG